MCGRLSWPLNLSSEACQAVPRRHTDRLLCEHSQQAAGPPDAPIMHRSDRSSREAPLIVSDISSCCASGGHRHHDLPVHVVRCCRDMSVGRQQQVGWRLQWRLQPKYGRND